MGIPKYTVVISTIMAELDVNFALTLAIVVPPIILGILAMMKTSSMVVPKSG